MVAPVMNFALSLARKVIGLGDFLRLADAPCRVQVCVLLEGRLVDQRGADDTGATAFTRMPSFAYIVPAARVMFTTPPFEAE